MLMAKQSIDDLERSKNMMGEGFEPSPMKTTALTLRLRPLGHPTLLNRVPKWVYKCAD